MKKILIISLIAITLAGRAVSQNYYVINAEGKIYAGSQLLKTGDKINDETEIKFTSVRDKLFLLSPEKGNFLIQPVKKTGETESNWITLIKNALPESKYYKTASRGEEKSSLRFNDLYDLMGFFRDKVTYVPGTRYSVNPDKIVLDENNYFRFTASPESKDQVVPGIDVFTDGFVLTGTESSKLPAELELYYVQKGKNTLIGKMLLNIRSRSAVQNELALMFSQTNSDIFTPERIYYEQVIPYIQESYGNTDQEVIREIIRKDLGVRAEFR